MEKGRVLNFAAGPSCLPLAVLERAQKELLNYEGTGMSVMEMSHRSPVFSKIIHHAEASFRNLLSIPDEYAVLFLQGGASTQFSMVPLNLLRHKADYIVTGNFAGKAFDEAKKYGEVHVAYDGKDTGFTHIPPQEELSLSSDGDYVHYCANNTIYGTQWHYIPDTHGIPLVADMSSCIASEPLDVTKFACIYAGAQKNLSPAGLTIVIIRKDMAGHEQAITPLMLSYQRMIDKESMYNTPPCFQIYMFSLMMDWLLEQGGVEEMAKRNREKADLLYRTLEQYPLYRLHAEKEARSLMNVTFRTGDAKLDDLFVKEAQKEGLVNLKGHRLTGGMRASLYNAMDIDGVKALCTFVEKFAREYGGNSHVQG